ncbi:uncharacterized protein VTP21DRAFT_2192 [Calcarisporiella thermophila]|uniref:uncharacterized protein n=1 Tax=Calcarisporiella thermophila TaxID=911321 RepID=UPI0037429BF4
MYVLCVPQDISFDALLERVVQKVDDKVNRIKWNDEDGDLVTMSSDEDVRMALKDRPAMLAVYPHLSPRLSLGAAAAA